VALLQADRLGRHDDRRARAMTTIFWLNVALGILIGVASGGTAFVVVRVLPVIGKATGVSDWLNRHDVTVNIFFWTITILRSFVFSIILMLAWQFLLAPPLTVIIFRLLFLPASLAEADGHGYGLLLGIVSAYAAYAYCVVIYENAYRNARQARS
jgi:hypothetical protein